MFNLKNVTVLTKAQQKNVRGGGTCGYYDGAGGVFTGLSKSEALHMFAGGGGGRRWCCDSCSSAWWYRAAVESSEVD